VSRRRDRFAAGSSAELSHDRRDVMVHRPGREHELVGDLSVPVTAGEQPEDFDLAPGELSSVGTRGLARTARNLGAQSAQPLARGFGGWCGAESL